MKYTMALLSIFLYVCRTMTKNIRYERIDILKLLDIQISKMASSRSRVDVVCKTCYAFLAFFSFASWSLASGFTAMDYRCSPSTIVMLIDDALSGLSGVASGAFFLVKISWYSVVISSKTLTSSGLVPNLFSIHQTDMISHTTRSRIMNSGQLAAM